MREPPHLGTARTTPLSRLSTPGARRVVAILSITASVFWGCSIFQIDFQTLPPAERFQSIRPGVTTRSEVLARLGPPEEIRRPAPFERARLHSPQHRRVIETGDIFGHQAYTYASGRRRTESLGLLPIGLSLLRVQRTRSTEERWRIEFDDEDVVQSISHVDELDRDG